MDIPRAVPIIAALILVAAFSGCEEEGAEETDTEVPAVPVVTLELGTSDFVERVEVSGVAEPIHEVRVAAEAPGRILTAPFEEGKVIEKGDLLVRVDAQLDSARIDLLQNQLASARREYERTKMLASEGLATPQQLDQAASSVDGAQLSLKQARVGIGKTTVRSPQTGIVARRYVEEGEYASPGAPIAHIVDYTTIVVEAAVPESEIGYVTPGSTVDVFIPALDRQVAGQVKRRAVLATPKTRTFPVEVHVPNGSLEILPGMRARVIIPRKKWEDVVVVPRDAILQGYEAKEAMVLPGSDEVGEAELRKVELGPARANDVVVTSGLSAGDRLIVKGHRSIVTGTKVRAVEQRTARKKDPEPADDSDSEANVAAEPEAELAGASETKPAHN